MPDNPVEVQYEPGYRLGYENGGKFFFNTVREGDSVLFATENEKDAQDWVMAFYR